MAFTQKVAELNESRNLSTSSWTVSGLKGDSFNYAFMAFCDSGGSTANDNLLIRLNSDSGTNYDNNNMLGAGSSSTINNATSVNAVRLLRFERNDSNRPSLVTGIIRGDSSQDRTITALYSSGNPRIHQIFSTWNNNVDELDEITFVGEGNASYTWHIVVWEVPKIGNNDNYELVDTLSWSASSTEQSITGLSGDTDLFYKLLWNSQDAGLNIEINNDAGANYKREQCRNSGSAFVATSGTDNEIGLKYSSQLLINAETGDERTSFTFGGGDGTNKQELRANWYTNTATELTSLYCTPSASTTAEAKLFRPKYPSSCVPDLFDLPFEKIDQFSVNTSDFTTGQSFSNLEGDKVLLFRVEWTGECNANIYMRTNGDSGASDYAFQRLTGDGTAEAASSDTALTTMQLVRDSNAKVAHGVVYIYPQSGEYRPALMYQMDAEDRIELRAMWRLETATEITSLLIYAGSASTTVGTCTLSAIYL